MNGTGLYGPNRRRERDLLVGRELLATEEDDLVVEDGAADLGDHVVVADVVREVDTADHRAARAGDPLDRDPTVRVPLGRRGHRHQGHVDGLGTDGHGDQLRECDPLPTCVIEHMFDTMTTSSPPVCRSTPSEGNMSPDERTRIELTQRLAELFGDDLAAYLMETVPPFSWHEVATKRDLAELESRLDRRFDELEARMNLRFDSKIDALDSKIGGLDSKIGGLDEVDGRSAGSIRRSAGRSAGSIRRSAGSIRRSTSGRTCSGPRRGSSSRRRSPSCAASW